MAFTMKNAFLVAKPTKRRVEFHCTCFTALFNEREKVTKATGVK